MQISLVHNTIGESGANANLAKQEAVAPSTPLKTAKRRNNVILLCFCIMMHWRMALMHGITEKYQESFKCLNDSDD
jgi:hypothetical protein